MKNEMVPEEEEQQATTMSCADPFIGQDDDIHIVDLHEDIHIVDLHEHGNAAEDVPNTRPLGVGSERESSFFVSSSLGSGGISSRSSSHHHNHTTHNHNSASLLRQHQQDRLKHAAFLSRIEHNTTWSSISPPRSSISTIRSRKQGSEQRPLCAAPGGDHRKGRSSNSSSYSYSHNSSPPHDEEKRWHVTKSVLRSLPYEYCLPDTTTKISIRRPYCGSEEKEPGRKQQAEARFWQDIGRLSTRMYQQTADINQPSTIEVAATLLEAPAGEETILTLMGESSVRYRPSSSNSNNNIDDDKKWIHYGSVDERDDPLGFVFIEKSRNNSHSGNKKKAPRPTRYSLDEIYEAAFHAREHFCSSVSSATAAVLLQENRMFRDENESPLWRGVGKKEEEDAHKYSGSGEIPPLNRETLLNITNNQRTTSHNDHNNTHASAAHDEAVLQHTYSADTTSWHRDTSFTDDARLRKEDTPSQEENLFLSSRSNFENEYYDGEGGGRGRKKNDLEDSNILDTLIGTLVTFLFYVVWVVLVRIPFRIFTFVSITIFALTTIYVFFLS